MLHDAACIWITKYDGYTPPERFITHNNPLMGSFATLIMLVLGPTLRDTQLYHGYTTAKRFINVCKVWIYLQVYKVDSIHVMSVIFI